MKGKKNNGIEPLKNDIIQLIRLLALHHQLDPDLSVRQCEAESSFNPSATSGAGAVGLFQLTDVCEKDLNKRILQKDEPRVDRRDWRSNIYGGLRYMQYLYRLYVKYSPAQKVALAYAAYNCGMGNVDDAIRRGNARWFMYVPRETKGYLKKILLDSGRPEFQFLEELNSVKS
jgi:soluble lytic murein transglycosylase